MKKRSDQEMQKWLWGTYGVFHRVLLVELTLFLMFKGQIDTGWHERAKSMSEEELMTGGLVRMGIGLAIYFGVALAVTLGAAAWSRRKAR